MVDGSGSRSGSSGRRGRRRIDDNVVMADFGARRRREQSRSERPRMPKLPTMQESWAAAQFMELVVGGAESGRIARGRDYFRAGKVISVEAVAEQLVGWVNGSQLEPFEVVIRLKAMDPATREGVRSLLDASTEAYRSLVFGNSPMPMLALPLLGEGEIASMRCDCPDKQTVCKHIVAVAMAYSKQLSEDPAELLRWRGINPQLYQEALDKQMANIQSDIARKYGVTWPPAQEPTGPQLVKETPAEIVNSDQFWGRDSLNVLWEQPEVEEGLQLGERPRLMEALETVTWTHVDQLDALHQIDRCYEELGNAQLLFDYSRRMSDVREINEAGRNRTDNKEEDES